ncbi:putative F-box/LRR-repeat protein 23 [Hordeum vulgare]|nr:putative F-box/LRR-repeat protein 23 [Hordeum vulgare]
MTHNGDILETEEAEAMARGAIDRAAGTLQSFCTDTFVTDALLAYISARTKRQLDLVLESVESVQKSLTEPALKRSGP